MNRITIKLKTAIISNIQILETKKNMTIAMAQTKKKFSDMTRHLEGKVLKQDLLPRSLDVLQPKLQHCIQKPTSSPQNQQDSTGEDGPERPKKHSVVKTHIYTLNNQIAIKKNFHSLAIKNAETSLIFNQ